MLAGYDKGHSVPQPESARKKSHYTFKLKMYSLIFIFYTKRAIQYFSTTKVPLVVKKYFIKRQKYILLFYNSFFMVSSFNFWWNFDGINEYISCCSRTFYLKKCFLNTNCVIFMFDQDCPITFFLKEEESVCFLAVLFNSSCSVIFERETLSS